jgi:Cof subfamily protein (haloacid dehalogenase superfamily)
MKIKAICTDIDGTLLNKNREISDRTIRAIQALPKDFPVILASSRMPSAMIHLQQTLDRVKNPLICYNGGFVVDYQKSTPEVLDNVAIPLEVCQRIRKHSESSSIHLSLYGRDDWYAPQVDYWTEREINSTKVKPMIAPFDKVMDTWEQKACGAHKVMAMGSAEEIEQLYQSLLKELDGEIHLYRSKDTYIEIAPKRISKASALELLLNRNYDIQLSEVMAFGDNYNDIDMLQAVGHGVAVANAREEVKAAADEITEKNIDDGVAIMIEKYCL